MSETTINIIVFSGLGLLIMAGFIYLYDDIFGRNKKRSPKSNVELREKEMV
ncbi:MAG: hypothetical protein AAF824_02675 [Bacteroidota bacterium]